MQKRKLSSRQTLLKFIEAVKVEDVKLESVKPYLTKTFLNVKAKTYLLDIPDDDTYGLKDYAHLMSNEQMLAKLQVIVKALTENKEKPFLENGVDKMLVEYSNELNREYQKRQSLVILNYILEGDLKVSQAIKNSGVMHDFDIQSKLGLLTCRLVKESTNHATDKGGEWGINPISFRIKKKVEDEKTNN